MGELQAVLVQLPVHDHDPLPRHDGLPLRVPDPRFRAPESTAVCADLVALLLGLQFRLCAEVQGAAEAEVRLPELPGRRPSERAPGIHATWRPLGRPVFFHGPHVSSPRCSRKCSPRYSEGWFVLSRTVFSVHTGLVLSLFAFPRLAESRSG